MRANQARFGAKTVRSYDQPTLTERAVIMLFIQCVLSFILFSTIVARHEKSKKNWKRPAPPICLPSRAPLAYNAHGTRVTDVVSYVWSSEIHGRRSPPRFPARLFLRSRARVVFSTKVAGRPAINARAGSGPPRRTRAEPPTKRVLRTCFAPMPLAVMALAVDTV